METKQELKFIFANINDLLKYGEAKHGGLILLNSGILIGIFSSFTNIQLARSKPIIIISVICFCISILVGIISQFPNTQSSVKNSKIVKNPNIYFFGHLAHLDSNAFINEFKNKEEDFLANKLDEDLISQILINSRIANSKFALFKIACFLTASGSVIIIIALIINTLCL